MGRRVDLEAGGGRFDSRRAQVTFFGHVGRVFLWIFTYVGTCWGHFFGRVGDTFWSGRGHFFVKSWVAWDVSGSGLGFSDRFGRVLGRMSDGVEQNEKIRNVREYVS